MPGLAGTAAAFQSGGQFAEELLRDKRQRKEQLADEERRQKVDELHSNALAIQKNLSKLSGDERKKAEDALTDINQAVIGIYHPIHNPGALQKDWHWLQGLIRKPKAAPAVLNKTTQPGTPEETISLGGEQVKLPATPPYQTVAPNVSAMTPQQRQGMAQRDQARGQTAQDVAAAGLTPEQEATVQARAESAGATAKIEETIRRAGQLGIKFTPEEIKSMYEAASGISARPAWKQYASPDGKSMQWFDLNRPDLIPPGWNAIATGSARPRNKLRMGVAPVRCTPGDKNCTGYVVLWGDGTHPGDKSQWEYTPIGATRYQQIIKSESSTIDPFGVISRTMRETGPKAQGFLDISGIAQGGGYTEEGEPVAPAATPAAPAPAGGPPAPKHPAAPAAGGPPAAPQVPTPQQARAGVPTVPPVVTNQAAPVGSYSNPLPLDATGHVPDSDPMNPLAKANVNRLLDGADIDKIGLTGRGDRAVVEQAAQKYGWEQGLFTPKDKLLIREAGSYLKTMRDAKSLKTLESYVSRVKMHNAIKAADGQGGFFTDNLALTLGLNHDEQDFVQRFLQTRGTVSGLAQLTRGGRTTEAGIKRLQAELPDPLNVHSVKDAQMRLDRLLSEIDVAQKQGFVADVEGSKGNETLVDKIDKLLQGGPTSGGSAQQERLIYDRKTGKAYKYKGSGNRNVLSNYEEVPDAPPK